MKKALLLLVIPCVMALRFPLIAMFRSQEITNFLISLCIENQFTKILDVGPGGPEFIFPLATHAVDYRQFVFPDSSNVTQLVVDIDQDRLPFPDKYFDFVYSRHVLEVSLQFSVNILICIIRIFIIQCGFSKK